MILKNECRKPCKLNKSRMAIRVAIRWQFLAIRTHVWQFVSPTKATSVGNPAILSTVDYPFKILKRESTLKVL